MLRLRVILPCLLVAFPFAAGAASKTVPTKPEHARPPIVTTWSSAFEKKAEFKVFEDGFVNGGNLASGDLDGDGNIEIVVGAGPGRAPDVRIFRQDGTAIPAFRAYPAWFMGGVRVAVGDLDGDGKAEIVTSPGPGLEPQINVFRQIPSPSTAWVGTGFAPAIPGGVWAYGKGFLGGVHVAVGDLDGDGKAEIVTSPGPGGGPHVRVWTGDMKLIRDFFAYDANMADGVTVAVARTPSPSAHTSEIVTGVESWSAPLIRRFTADGNLLKEFFSSATSSRVGVSVTAWDMDGDGIDEIAVTPNGSVAPEIQIYDRYGTLYRTVSVMDADYRGSLSVAPVPDGLVVMPLLPVVVGPLDKEKFIDVNLAQQRLYAYEHGRVARTFLVSTGLAQFPTPEMAVTVTEKIPIKRYRWSYGPGNPNNYDLPNVRWNLRILGPFHIHYAYWHNNFGNRMSHGCINVGKADAEWVYNWASVGTPVAVTHGTVNEKAAGVRFATKK